MSEFPQAFPVVSWGNTTATFLPTGTELPSTARITAALAFAIMDQKFLAADIVGRGWCIPGGHLYEGETPEQAVRRETIEETGATLGDLTLLGHYLLTDPDSSQQIVPTYIASVLHVGPLPPETESRGIRTFSREELPDHYFLWDPLIEAVFNAVPIP